MVYVRGELSVTGQWEVCVQRPNDRVWTLLWHICDDQHYHITALGKLVHWWTDNFACLMFSRPFWFHSVQSVVSNADSQTGKRARRFSAKTVLVIALQPIAQQSMLISKVQLLWLWAPWQNASFMLSRLKLAQDYGNFCTSKSRKWEIGFDCKRCGWFGNSKVRIKKCLQSPWWWTSADALCVAVCLWIAWISQNGERRISYIGPCHS